MRSVEAAAEAAHRVWPEAGVVVDFGREVDLVVRGRHRTTWFDALAAVLLIPLALLTPDGSWTREQDRKTKVRGGTPDATAVRLGEAGSMVLHKEVMRIPWLAVRPGEAIAFVLAEGEAEPVWQGQYRNLHVRGRWLCLSFADDSLIEVPIPRAQARKIRALLTA